MSLKISIDQETITSFCKKWGIVEFSLFGSVLRDDFRPDSDVDVLVTFGPDSDINFDNRVNMLDELKDIFGREVDLISKKALRNPFRRHEILTHRKILYVKPNGETIVPRNA